MAQADTRVLAFARRAASVRLVSLAIFFTGVRALEMRTQFFLFSLNLAGMFLFRGNWRSSTRNNYFEVIGCHSGKRYRICHGNGAKHRRARRSRRPNNGVVFRAGEHLVAGRRHAWLKRFALGKTDEAGALEKANKFTPR